MPPILAILLEQAFAKGGPAAMQLIHIAQEHGHAEDVAELNRQIATDETLKAGFQREIDRMTALLATPAAAPAPEPTA